MILARAARGKSIKSVMENNIIKEFEKVRDIPYRIALLLDEPSGDCLGKAQLLFKIFEKYGYKVRYRICKIKWSSLNLPDEITKIPHDDNCSHAYLEVKINEDWKIIDPTWDKGLKNLFPINEWDGKSGTKLAIPSAETLTPEASLEHLKYITTLEGIESDLKENGKFYKALNEWLEISRQKI